MWMEHAEDRAFLRALARDVVAAEAPEELDQFETLVERCFAHPGPALDCSRPPAPLQRVDTASLAEIAPAALAVVLNFLLIELDSSSQQAASDGLKIGLKRLFWRGGHLPDEGIWLKEARAGRPERLTMIIYAYLLPVSTTVSTQALFEVAEMAGHLYGLDEQRCVLLGNAVLSRLCRYART